ncbi:MAG: thioredoxin domain-containing protein [Elusimicrobiota bacterium]|jgi:protein-disulfide isomerase
MLKKFYLLIVTVGLSSGVASAQSADTQKAMARIGQTVLTETQMRNDLGVALYEAENTLYQVEKNWIDQQAKVLLFQRAATEAGLAVEAWRAREIDGAVTPPSQTEIHQLLERVPANQRASTETVHQATQQLTYQKRLQKENELYQQLSAKYPIEVFLSKPVPPHINVSYAPDDPAKGRPNAPVTILEFTDFQCPYCKRAQETLLRVEAAYPNQVKIVARQYPLPFHNRAKAASEAALCAKEQGKFWEMREKLFEKQQLEDADFKRYAQELRLDGKKFDHCLTDHRMAARIDADVADGQRFGVRGTPHFFVNGQPINGAQPYEAFDQAIKDALAAKKK